MVREFFVPLRPVNGKKGVLKRKTLDARKTKQKPLPRTPLLHMEVHKNGPYHRDSTRANVKELTMAEKKQAAFDLRVQGYSMKDIANAIGTSAEWVAMELQEALIKLNEATAASVEQYRAMELFRLDALLLSTWQYRVSPKGVETILKVMERRHKLLGLETTKHELMGANGGPIQLATMAALDLTKLNDEELQWLEIIVSKAGPQNALTPQQRLAPPIPGECKAVA